MAGRIAVALVLAGAFPSGAAVGDLFRTRGEVSVVSDAMGEAKGVESRATESGPDKGVSDSEMDSGRTQGVSPSVSNPLITLPFPEQFFVPLMRDGEMRGMMILSLAIEVDEKDKIGAEARNLHLRDALLRRLLIHANVGGFDGNFTIQSHLDLLRKQLQEAVGEASDNLVKSVLVTDISYRGAE